MGFTVGETVVYPHHGAALIEAIEKRVIKGEEKAYLVLKVAQGDLTVRVPADNAEIVGVRDVVNSPSFTLMAEYEGRLRLFHLDLYRLSGSAEVLAGGLLDERQSDGGTLTEWAERLDAALDPERLDVRLAITGDERREIRLATESPRYARYLEAAAAWAAANGGPKR